MNQRVAIRAVVHGAGKYFVRRRTQAVAAELELIHAILEGLVVVVAAAD